VTQSYALSTLLKQIKAQKRDFWRANIFGTLATLMLLPLPILIPMLIDEVLLEHPGRITVFVTALFGQSDAWVYVAVVLVCVVLLRMAAFIFANLKTFYATRLTQKIGYLLRHGILHHLERVSISEYETLKSGGVASKTIQDVEAVSSFAGMLVTTLLSASLMVIGVAAIMLWMNWILALLVFTLNPFFLAFSRIIGKKTSELFRRQNEAYELYHDALNETLELFIQVRASNQERNFFGLIQNRAKEIEKASLDYGYKASVAHASSALLTSTVVDIFRALGIAAVAYSDLSIGMMLAFLFYLSTIVTPIQQLMGLVVTYNSTKPAFARINTLLKLKHEPHYPHEKNPFEDVKSTSVELRNVSFAYSEKDTVLKNISLKAKKGQKIALIGSSGSGKSTIAQLMVGLYAPTGGEILYGDTPIEKIGLPVVRKNVALMLQESLFFNDTIRMNLTFSADITDEDIFDALRASHLEGFVKTLKDGLDSRIGKNGIRLSGGQRQRLAIARLILSDPSIVIFDESTSALDNETEYRLYETLSEFLDGRTVVIIAHRTTTIRQAEYIYLIADGEIKHEGSYRELASLGLIREDFDV
jgi:ATP-binding cassette subfamily C protein